MSFTKIGSVTFILSVFLVCCGSNSAFMSYKKKIGALGIHEIFAPYFLQFCLIWLKFGTDAHRNLSCDVMVMKCGPVKAILYLGV